MKAQKAAKTTMTLLSTDAEGCSACGRKHGADEPHDASTLYYLTRFHMVHGRPGTWADAMAHCADDVQTAWRIGLRSMGEWSEPPSSVDPIAEPPGEPAKVVVDEAARDAFKESIARVTRKLAGG